MNENKSFAYRLGIDLGTSSIGTAVYRTDKSGEILSLEHLDSYIFGEPVVPKEMVTLNTARRSARLIRRQVERKAARLKKIGYIAQSLGITREDIQADKQDVIELRAKAVNEKISLPQLIKVLCHIVKNRGYKGFLSQEEKGTIGKKLTQTSTLLNDNKTLGQLLWEEKQKAAKGKPWRKIEDDGTFIYRQKIEEEFELIWQKQVSYHPELNGQYNVWGPNMFPDFPNQKVISLKNAFHSALFYQRPIKWELESVGDCPFFPQEKRASRAQIAYQHYRLAREIGNLRTYTKGHRDYKSLPQDIQIKLFDFVDSHTELYSKEDGTIPFSKIYEFLGFEKDVSFTIDRGSKRGLKGNSTLFEFEKTGLLNQWAELTDKEQELVIEFLSNITTMSDLADNNRDYIREKISGEKRLTKNISASTEELEHAADFVLRHRDRLSLISLESGRSSYSVKGLTDLTDAVLKGELTDSNEEKYIQARVQRNKVYTGKLRTLDTILKQESINDPVISRALAEFHRVMTYILHKYGKPQEIVVELSREMKNSLRRRQFLEGQSKLQAEERKKAIQELQTNGVLVSPRNIEKWLLWEEQNHTCPYSGQNISFAQAFDEKQTQVDHIVPQRGEIAGPNVFENKVLVFTDENKDKSNRLPYEWKFTQDIDDYNALNAEKKSKRKKSEKTDISFGNHSPLINFVQHLWGLYMKEKKGYYSAREHKYKPTQKGAKILRKISNLLMTPSQLKSDFENRQNQETAWIGKIVLDWCTDVCHKVTPSYGALTAYLRHELKFDEILPTIRIIEHKPLYDKDDKEIDFKKWEELFTIKDLKSSQADSLKDDFERYCVSLSPQPVTESDKERAFRDFCREQRTQLQFNKRCDHRHHAVDAAVIGLCNLSLVQRASEHNGKYGTLHKFDNGDGTITPGFTVDNIPQYAALRDEVQKRLTNYVVWHKPDHFPSGKFFDETAYSVQKDKKEKEVLVHRAPLSKFLKTNAEQTIKNLEKLLFADTIKSVIISEFQKRLAQGMTQEEALCGKKDDPQDGIYYRGNKVKQVKYMYLVGKGIKEFDENADKKIKGKKGSAYKAYQNGGYACMDFDVKTGKRVALIPLWKYEQNKQIPEGIIRVFIGDILFNKTTQQFYKVQKFSAEAGLQALPVTEVKGKFKSVSALQNEYVLVPKRQDIAKLKNEHTTSN